MPLAVTVLLLTASAGVTAFSITSLPFYEDKSDPPAPIVVLTALLWLLFVAAIVALRRVDARRVSALVLLGSLAIGGAALLGPPNTSTDSARYAWDGIVQNAGVSPYRYVPADPALAGIRPDWLFSPPTIDADGDPQCDGQRTMGARQPGTDEVVCTTINRANVPTIYPPTAELFFAGIRLIVGPDAEYLPLQAAGLVMSLAVTVMLLGALVARGRDPRWAALWGWSPLVATEAVTNSHVDMLAALLLLAASLLVAGRHRWWGGIALGASIAVKLTPVIGAPALIRRHGWTVIVGAIATFGLLYVPYILSTGVQVLGYLPGYLTEEGFDSGDRFRLISIVAPGPAATVVAAVVLVVTAVLVLARTDPDDPWLGQLVMIGVTLLVVTPRYPWYALLLLPFVAMTGRWEWITIGLAITVRALLPSSGLTRTAFGIALVTIVVMSLRRAGPGALGRAGRALRHPFRAPAAAVPLETPIRGAPRRGFHLDAS